jgi:sortase A
MTKSFIALVFAAVASLSFGAERAFSNSSSNTISVENVTPLPPDTGLQENEAILQVFEDLLDEPNPAQYPSRLIIPSIKLDAPIEYLGLNEKGEMGVPDGGSNKVGWYEPGTIPGKKGSAVMDAHVYAAFNKLRYVLPGQDIYVVTRGGETLHFVVEESMVYPLAEVPRDILFNRKDGRRLNLITCAGKYSKKLETYEKRLVTYAKLID